MIKVAINSNYPVNTPERGLDAFQVGDLIAVENYTPPQNGGVTYSILSLTEVYPSHFATQGPDAYPGHVFESMKSIKEDWEKQDDKYCTRQLPSMLLQSQRVGNFIIIHEIQENCPPWMLKKSTNGWS